MVKKTHQKTKIIKMEYIDDLSWSNIVSLVQHEEIAGADLINNFALELEELRKEKEEAEKALDRINSREQSLITAGHHVVQHLRKALPLTIQRQGYVAVVTTENLTINRNVI